MPQTREEITTNLTERLCWQVARRLYRKELVDGVYPLTREPCSMSSFTSSLETTAQYEGCGHVTRTPGRWPPPPTG